MEHLWTAAFEAHEIGKEGNGKACKDVNAEITDKKKKWKHCFILSLL